MSHSHNVNRHHGQSNIKLAFFMNFGFTILDFFGGMYVNSIAIIFDALHDLGDSLSLGLAWYLDSKSKQGADKSFTFGYTWFSLLGALVNGYAAWKVSSGKTLNEKVKITYLFGWV